MAQLLSTKLHVPTFQPDMVRRLRLTQKLMEGVMKRLILISAPAGFGKTTLLSEWHAYPEGNHLPLAWVWARSKRTIPIPRFRTFTQVEENINAFNFGPLSTKQMEQMDAMLGRVLKRK